jgi:hypothetical protein
MTSTCASVVQAVQAVHDRGVAKPWHPSWPRGIHRRALSLCPPFLLFVTMDTPGWLLDTFNIPSSSGGVHPTRQVMGPPPPRPPQPQATRQVMGPPPPRPPQPQPQATRQVMGPPPPRPPQPQPQATRQVMGPPYQLVNFNIAELLIARRRIRDRMQELRERRTRMHTDPMTEEERAMARELAILAHDMQRISGIPMLEAVCCVCDRSPWTPGDTEELYFVHRPSHGYFCPGCVNM